MDVIHLMGCCEHLRQVCELPVTQQVCKYCFFLFLLLSITHDLWCPTWRPELASEGTHNPDTLSGGQEGKLTWQRAAWCSPNFGVFPGAAGWHGDHSIHHAHQMGPEGALSSLAAQGSKLATGRDHADIERWVGAAPGADRGGEKQSVPSLIHSTSIIPAPARAWAWPVTWRAVGSGVNVHVSLPLSLIHCNVISLVCPQGQQKSATSFLRVPFRCVFLLL